MLLSSGIFKLADQFCNSVGILQQTAQPEKKFSGFDKSKLSYEQRTLMSLHRWINFNTWDPEYPIDGNRWSENQSIHESISFDKISSLVSISIGQSMINR